MPLTSLVLLTAMLQPAQAELPDGDCDRPWPARLPAAAPADKAQMVTLQETVQDYLARANDYLACNQQRSDEIAAGISEDSPPEALATAQRQLDSLLSRYNSTVDEMHQVGDRFNTLVREFKDR